MKTDARTGAVFGELVILTGLAAVVGLAASLALVMVVLLFSQAARADDVAASGYTASLAEVQARGGLWYMDQAARAYRAAPALETAVNATVSGMVSRVTVSQSFSNTSDSWQEGIYVFPLPDAAAVDHLRMWIGERVIEGVVQERQQAKKTYEQAKQQGQRASLVEQERPNIFTTSVANIAPGAQIRIEIEYQQDVRYDDGEMSMRLPLVIGPRYIPGVPVAAEEPADPAASGWSPPTDQVPDAARITPPVLHPAQGKINPVTLFVDLQPGFAVDDVRSRYHPVVLHENGTDRVAITLAEGQVPADRDFVLSWRPAPSREPVAMAFSESVGDSRYLLLNIMPPPETGLPFAPPAREVVFVIDSSGSMAGTSIVQARTALAMALARLNAGDRFNIVEFNDQASSLFDAPVPATAQNLRRAQSYVESMQANGGTNMAPALRLALAGDGGGLLKQVVFLTDGAVGNEDGLFRLIHAQLGNARLFTVGIGSAPNTHFMRKAADYGRGSFTHIGDVNEVGERMQALFRKLEAPALTDIVIDWPRGSEVEQWPQRTPDLYFGEPLVVAARLDRIPSSLRLRGRYNGDEWSRTITLHERVERPGIGKLWARRKIESLMDQIRNGGDADALRGEIIEVALTHHLVSRYTSLVAVDVTPVRPVDEKLGSGQVPSNLPHGWNYAKVFGALPQTATPARVHLLIGMILVMLGLLLFAGRRREISG